jgi:hypothetical protein
LLPVIALSGEQLVAGSTESPLEYVSRRMRQSGALRVIFKLLANNDNSKQQVYFGSDFDVLRLIPHGDLVGAPTKDKGLMFKAPVNLSWIDIHHDTPPAPAPGAQLILYPRYPEVRFSGFVKGCALAPSHLMQPPTPEERARREAARHHRCLVLGICKDRVLAYCGTWDGDLSRDAKARIAKSRSSPVASVFHEIEQVASNSRTRLLSRLAEIYKGGPVSSRRLNSGGDAVAYHARNGAGYTLESLFGIVPNGRSEPDYEGWELKSHGAGAVTLMTPEPDAGTYRADLGTFLAKYGVCGTTRRDFTGKHPMNVRNERSGLELRMEGYDPVKAEVADPDGGLVLRDRTGSVAAAWTFNKILSHWSRKHSQTAYVTYTATGSDSRSFQFGPKVHLCEGAGLKPFLTAMHSNVIYYDPGINMKLHEGRWVSKKRNQFRVSWKNIGLLYEKNELILLSDP